MNRVRLFDGPHGAVLEEVELPDGEPPDVIIWRGRLFLLLRTRDGDDYYPGTFRVVNAKRAPP